MYYTRALSEQIKTNNACLNRIGFFIHTAPAEIYNTWLLNLKQQFPEFNIDVFLYWESRLDQLFTDIHKRKRDELKPIDTEGMKIEYYDVNKSEPCFDDYINRQSKRGERRKVNWIYNKLTKDPHQFIENIKNTKRISRKKRKILN